MTNPMSAVGDIIQGGAAGAPAALAASATAGAHIISQGAAAALAYFFGSPQLVEAGISSDISTTSGYPVEISTSLRITATVGASGVAIALGSANVRMGAVTADATIQVSAAAGSIQHAGSAGWDGVAGHKTIPIFSIFTGLTPGSTLFKLYWGTSGLNTAYLDGASRGAAQIGTRWMILPL